MYRILVIFMVLLNILSASNNSSVVSSINCSSQLSTKQIISEVEAKFQKTLYNEIATKNREQIDSNINLLIWVLTAFMGILMFYGVVIELKKFKDKNLIETKVNEEVINKTRELRNNIEDKFRNIENNINKLIRDNIDEKIKSFYAELKKKEKIKNNVIYNLNKWLRNKLNIEDKDNTYSWYNERFYIVNKLAYGSKSDIKKVLIELQGAAAKDLLRLPSFKELLSEISKEDIELDTLVEKLLNSEL